MRPPKYPQWKIDMIFKARKRGRPVSFIATLLDMPLETVRNYVYKKCRRKAAEKYYKKNREKIIKKMKEYNKTYKRAITERK